MAAGAPAGNRIRRSPRSGRRASRNERARAARRVRGVARRRGRRAGGARLRASRRAARRAAGGVGQPAVRAGAARWPATRPRRLRRQGSGPVPHPWSAREPRRRRGGRAAGHAEAADRRRGGVRLAALRGPAATRAGPAALRRHRHLRHHDVVGGRAVHVRGHARRGGRGGQPARPGARPAFRVVRRRRAEPAARDGRSAGRLARRRRPGHAAGLLRRRAAAVGRGARR